MLSQQDKQDIPILFYSIICRVHDQELLLGRIARDLGFAHVSLSHEVMPMVKIVARGNTTVIDAYLTPHIKQYLTVRQN
jgi:N-methylhydantoinase A/acetone carboxylase, beta subunit